MSHFSSCHTPYAPEGLSAGQLRRWPPPSGISAIRGPAAGAGAHRPFDGTERVEQLDCFVRRCRAAAALGGGLHVWPGFER
jgi:hypothetical protein